MRDPLPEAYELVEDGVITEDNFRDFTFANSVHLWGTQNPRFFEGTRVAKEAARSWRARAACEVRPLLRAVGPAAVDAGIRAHGVNNALEQVKLADELGFDYVWAVEHHFLEEYSHCPARRCSSPRPR